MGEKVDAEVTQLQRMLRIVSHIFSKTGFAGRRNMDHGFEVVRDMKGVANRVI